MDPHSPMDVAFAEADAAARPVHLIKAAGFDAWCRERPEPARRWLEATGFKAKPGAFSLIPDTTGDIAEAVLITHDPAEPWDAALLPEKLPGGTWRIEDAGAGLAPVEAALGFGLGSYRFERYRTSDKADDKPRPRLALGDDAESARGRKLAAAIALGRDLVNTPANEMGPGELAGAIAGMGEAFGAGVEVIEGPALLDNNLPMIHAVGQASTRAPRLVDLTWGEPEAPRLTLVGKGVCFDTGGLDIKPASGMALMKKDMGGAAAMTALARAVMDLGLPVRLRLLVPAVENSIAGNAFRPGDVWPTRKGLKVEIGNTDAEGRLVLADALTLASEEKPALLLDAATLTGAARVALGAQLPVLFANDDALADAILEAGRLGFDPLWRMPLHKPYNELIKSRIADVNNAGQKPQAGAITAALFLERFVGEGLSWAHLDIFGWNDEARPGRPKGGEATAVRALFDMVRARFGGEVR